MNPSHHFHLALIMVVLAYVLTLLGPIESIIHQPSRQAFKESAVATTSTPTPKQTKENKPTPIPQSFLDDYNGKYLVLPDYKAIALALDSDGTATWGWNYRSDTQPNANDRALSVCNRDRSKNNTRSDCKLYAVGGVIVWDTQGQRFDLGKSIENQQITPKKIADGSCNRSAECGNNICIKSKCRPMLSIGEECEYSGQCRAPSTCVGGRCSTNLDNTVARKAESDMPPSAAILQPNSQVKCVMPAGDIRKMGLEQCRGEGGVILN